jgi:anti-sigma B factor antagonist
LARVRRARAATGLAAARRREIPRYDRRLRQRSLGMVIEERVVNDVTILDLKGKITLGDGDEALKDKINSLVLQNRRRILLNLAEVPYIDSAGLGEVVRTYTTVSRQGGQLKLVNLTKRITDLLSITKLLTVFETFETEEAALKSFS